MYNAPSIQDLYRLVGNRLARTVTTGRPVPPVLETVHERLKAAVALADASVARCDRIVADIERRSGNVDALDVCDAIVAEIEGAR